MNGVLMFKGESVEWGICWEDVRGGEGEPGHHPPPPTLYLLEPHTSLYYTVPAFPCPPFPLFACPPVVSSLFLLVPVFFTLFFRSPYSLLSLCCRFPFVPVSPLCIFPLFPCSSYPCHLTLSFIPCSSYELGL